MIAGNLDLLINPAGYGSNLQDQTVTRWNNEVYADTYYQQGAPQNIPVPGALAANPLLEQKAAGHFGFAKIQRVVGRGEGANREHPIDHRALKTILDRPITKSSTFRFVSFLTSLSIPC